MTTVRPVPFNRPYLAPGTIEAVRAAFAAGHISGNGAVGQRCERLLERALGVPRVLLTTSCTHALEMAGLLLGLGPGDEVVLPAFTFASTANAFVLRGARPVFVDIRPDTLNLDEGLLDGAITARTRAIAVVHYAGVACEMDAILAVARRRGLPVVEDNAHGLFGAYRGRPLGSMGAFAALSFHETKNIACGEGGGLVLNRARDEARAEIIWEKGTDRSRFFRGLVDRYTWRAAGSNYAMSEVLAAVLWSQLRARGAIQRRRRALWRRYDAGLAPWCRDHGVARPLVPSHCRQSYHMFHMLLPDAGARTGLLRHLGRRRIQAVFHYVPLHTSAMGRRFGGRAGQLPVTESVAGRLVRLPFYTALARTDQDRVIDAVLAFRP